jgi:hypothetical protein
MILYLTFCNIEVQAQHIVAGVVSSSDIYTDIPDQSIDAYDSTAIDSCSFSLCIWLDTFRIDIDSNGVDDFLLISRRDSSQLSNAFLLRLDLKPLHSEAQVAAYSDTTTSSVGATSVFRTALVNNYGDSINNSLTYDLSTVVLMFSVYYGQGGESLLPWHNLGDAYIGVRLASVDTAYGWIRVNNFTSKLIVKDYAINDPTLSNFEIEKATDNLIRIYPNPVKEQLRIERNVSNSPLNMTIYNSAGQVMEDSIFESEQLQIDCSNYPAGIYYVRVVSKNKIYSKKFVKY